jgi:hypothetical protein
MNAQKNALNSLKCAPKYNYHQEIPNAYHNYSKDEIFSVGSGPQIQTKGHKLNYSIASVDYFKNVRMAVPVNPDAMDWRKRLERNTT